MSVLPGCVVAQMSRSHFVLAIGVALLFKVVTDEYTGQVLVICGFSSLMQGINSHLLVLQFAELLWFCVFFPHKVSLEDKNAVVVYDSKLQTPATLQEAIYDMGFDATLADSNPQPVLHDTVFLTIPTQSSLSPNQICSALLKNKGILDVKMSSDQKTAVVTFLPSIISAKQIIHLVPGVDLTISAPEITPGTWEDCSWSQASSVVLRLKVAGMTCHSCTSTIEGKIGKLQGVQRIKGKTLVCFHVN